MKVDPALHAEVLARYKKLNLAPYKGFVNPVYELVTDKDGISRMLPCLMTKTM